MIKQEYDEKLGLRVFRLEDLGFIRWREDPTKYLYLRELTYISTNPRHIPLGRKNDKCRLIGWGVEYIEGEAHHGRFFYLTDFDAGEPKNTPPPDGYGIGKDGRAICPGEAVRIVGKYEHKKKLAEVPG